MPKHSYKSIEELGWRQRKRRVRKEDHILEETVNLQTTELSHSFGSLQDPTTSTKSESCPTHHEIIESTEDRNDSDTFFDAQSFENDDELILAAQTTQMVDTEWFDIDSDDEDSNSEENIFDVEAFRNQLSMWGSKDIPQVKLTALLVILRTHPNLKSLPADARTLLETPRVVETRPVGNGRYCHLGVRSSIDFIFSQYPELKNGSSLILQCSSDGMPTTKSTNDQLWPILLSFPDFKYIDPIVVGIYHGKEKPSDVDGFMDEFVSEISDLEHNNYNYLDTVFNVEVLNYVFDSPAKALLCCVKGHAGYNSCMRCKVKGTYDTNKVIFDEFESPVRTDAEFRAKQHTDHHIRREPSPLEKIPKTNMVTDMVLDYMHLVLLGIVRKVLFLFIKGKCIARLPSRMIRLFNDKIESIKSFIPSDFSRKPRSLNDLLRWKATECRLFLLYTAPFLLQGVVSQDVMKHFLSLHVAIRILVTPSYIKNNIDFARSLLVYFVKNFKTLYGRSNMTFNLHGLLHLCDDVEKFGPLDNYSAFRYENFLQCLKKMLRKSIQPLQQVYKRIYELRNCFQRKDIPTKFSEFKETNKNVLLPHTMTSPCYTSFKLNSSKITCKSPNNVVVLDTGEIVIIHHIATTNSETFISGCAFDSVTDFYATPIASSEVGIYRASNLLENSSCWPISSIKCKAMSIPIDSDLDNRSYYVAELLHHET